MGRSSSSSCLKIIACGSDAAENDDDVEASPAEGKATGDKRGWSFRKRSGRHRVLGNNVSSENPTFADKEISQVVDSDLQESVKSTTDEKSQLPRPVEKIAEAVDEKPQLPRPVEKISEAVDEKLQLPTPVEKISETVVENPQLPIAHEKNTEAVFATEHHSETKSSSLMITSENGSDATYADSKMCEGEVALEIGSNATSTESKATNAVVVSENDGNSILTESKMANVVAISEIDSNNTSAKLSECEGAMKNGESGVIMYDNVAIIIQTFIRGFLTRRGFVQLKSAIKLQAAIRGHLVRRNAVETLHCYRGIVKVQALVRARSSKHWDQKDRPSEAQISTVKLLKNSFARQLLESTPKPKSVNIRCDPLKPNSAWGWLERWMAVTTPDDSQKLEHIVDPEDDKIVQKAASLKCFEFTSVVSSESVDSKSSRNELAKSLENEESFDAKAVDSESCYPLSTEVKTEESLPQEDVASVEMDARANEFSYSQADPISVPDEPTVEREQPKLSTKRSASEELNGEEKKFAYGSRKASNPAFIAAQSKFEELTSVANSGQSISSSPQDVGSESHFDTASYLEERAIKIAEPNKVEASVHSDPRIHVADSECGTEISVSSTLDSPDRSDFGNAEAEQEAKFVEEPPRDPKSRKGPNSDASGLLNGNVVDLPSAPIQQEEIHRVDNVFVNPAMAEVSPQVEQKLEMYASDLQSNVEPGGSVMATDSSLVEQKHELNGSDVQIEQGSEKGQTYKPSPEASPKSHMTFPESQGTPSSQVSIKSKRNKIDKSGSNTKRSSLSAGKRSPSKPNLDSGARSSTEHLPKDHKSGKRRSSFGSTKSDNVDQEPRESSSQNSLPSYMQATESARAKANSPRSSPDVHDKEVYTKKRHSLPGASGRQGSPRIQRSSSQAAQGVKANGSHTSNERKWQR